MNVQKVLNFCNKIDIQFVTCSYFQFVSKILTSAHFKYNVRLFIGVFFDSCQGKGSVDTARFSFYIGNFQKKSQIFTEQTEFVLWSNMTKQHLKFPVDPDENVTRPKFGHCVRFFEIFLYSSTSSSSSSSWYSWRVRSVILFLNPQDEVGPSISSSVVPCSFVLSLYIVMLVLVFCCVHPLYVL